MNLQPHDSVLRWLVESESRPGEHQLVDLGEGDGGECSCEDFQFRRHRCKHITAVREHLLDLIIFSHVKEIRKSRGGI